MHLRRTIRIAGLSAFAAAAVLTVSPAVSPVAASVSAVCVVPAAAHSDAKAKPGGSAKHDPNEITAAELAGREKDVASALRLREQLRLPIAAASATVTIPV